VLRRSLARLISALAVAAAVGVVAASDGSDGALRFERLDSPEPPHRSIYALHQDVDGFLWIGTPDGLARYDGYEMRTFRHDPNDPQSLSNSSINVIFEDSRGRFWVGTENGLNILDRRRFSFIRMPPPGHPEGDGAWFHCAFEDREGGLFRLDPHVKAFSHIWRNPANPDSLSANAVSAIAEAPDGDLWVATYGGGLNRVDRTTGIGLEISGSAPRSV